MENEKFNPFDYLNKVEPGRKNHNIKKEILKKRNPELNEKEIEKLITGNEELWTFEENSKIHGYLIRTAKQNGKEKMTEEYPQILMKEKREENYTVKKYYFISPKYELDVHLFGGDGDGKQIEAFLKDMRGKAKKNKINNKGRYFNKTNQEKLIG